MALLEPMDNQWTEADELKATKQYFLAQDLLNPFENSQNEDFHIETID